MRLCSTVFCSKGLEEVGLCRKRRGCRAVSWALSFLVERETLTKVPSGNTFTIMPWVVQQFCCCFITGVILGGEECR